MKQADLGPVSQGVSQGSNLSVGLGYDILRGVPREDFTSVIHDRNQPLAMRRLAEPFLGFLPCRPLHFVGDRKTASTFL